MTGAEGSDAGLDEERRTEDVGEMGRGGRQGAGSVALPR